jgi:rhodanese-related sulfurtransferase
VLLDVRPAEAFATARPRGALSVPLLPTDTLVERAAAAVGREPDSRIVVAGGGDTDDAERAARALLGAGYANAVVLEGGFARCAS